MHHPGTSRAEKPCNRASASPEPRALAWRAILSIVAIGLFAGYDAIAEEPPPRRIPEPSFYAEEMGEDSEPAVAVASAATPHVLIEAPPGYVPDLSSALFHAPPDYFVRSIRTVAWDEPTSLAIPRGWTPPAIPPGLVPQYIPGELIEAPSPSDHPSYSLPGAPGVADVEANWSPGNAHHSAPPCCDAEEFRFRVLPDGVLWKAYLAGVKESRLSAHIIGVDGDSTFFDGTLGGRFALWRYGNGDAFHPEGVEFDIEGAAQVRLDIPNDVDVRSVDFRAGGFFTWGDRWRQTKMGYYHLSSHLGDEFLLKHPGYPRLNFARDVIIIAHSIYLTEELRIYGEAGWAFWTDVTEPWEFQFGLDYSPAGPTGPQGAPFFALNTHLRQELDFSGNFVAQAGWAWKGDESGNMFRAGLHYFNGQSSQFSFYHRFEQQIGFGIWFDR